MRVRQQWVESTPGHCVLNPRLEVIFHALAGAFGMVVESAITFPLDTLKTRYQLISNVSASSAPSMFNLTQSMIRNEGILSLYRGLPIVILMQAPRGALKFGANYSIQNVIHDQVHFIQNVNALNFISGLGTGIFDGTIVAPFEFIKVRMQSQQYRDQYRNTLSALYHIIWRQRRVLSLFCGMELTLWRNGLWHGVYFGSLGKQKEATDRFGKSKVNDFVIGCIGGALGCIPATPFDVAKSRMQNQELSPHQKSNPWALTAVGNVYRDEGWTALYRGFVPRILRMGLGGGILIFSFEYTLSLIEIVHLFATRHI